MGFTLGQELDWRFWEIPERLREARAGLDELQQLIRESPAAAREIGRDLVRAEMRFGELVSEYQRIYTAIFGEPDTGLGALPVAAWMLAAIAALVFAVTSFIAGLQDLRERSYRLVRAQERGEPLPWPAPKDWREVFQQISPWVLVAAAVFAAALFGRR